MSEQRRATVMIIQRGDREIAGALMAGVIAARGNREQGTGNREQRTGNRDSVPEAQPVDTMDVYTVQEAQPVDTLEVYTVQEDKWRRVARQVHVAIGNTKTPEDYRMLIVKAHFDYATRQRRGPLHTVAGKLLLAWALLWQGIWRAYDAQDRVLRP